MTVPQHLMADHPTHEAPAQEVPSAQETTPPSAQAYAAQLRELYQTTTGPWPVQGPHSLYRRGPGRKAGRHEEASRAAARDAVRRVATALLSAGETPDPPPEWLYLPPTELIKLSFRMDALAQMGGRTEAQADQVWRLLTAGHAWAQQTLAERQAALPEGHEAIRQHYATLISTEPRWPIHLEESAFSAHSWADIAGVSEITQEEWSSLRHLNVPTNLHLETLPVDEHGHPLSAAQIGQRPHDVRQPDSDPNWWIAAAAPLQRTGRHLRGTSRLCALLSRRSGPVYTHITAPAEMARATADLAQLRGLSSHLNPHAQASRNDQILNRLVKTRFETPGSENGARIPYALELMAALDDDALNSTEIVLSSLPEQAARDLSLTVSIQEETQISELLDAGVLSEKLPVRHRPLPDATTILLGWTEQLILQGWPQALSVGSSLRGLSHLTQAALKEMSPATLSAVIGQATEHRWNDELRGLTHISLRADIYEIARTIRVTKKNKESAAVLLAQVSPRPWAHLNELHPDNALSIIATSYGQLSQKQFMRLIGRAEKAWDERTRPAHLISCVWERPPTQWRLNMAANKLGIEASPQQLTTLAIIGLSLNLADEKSHYTLKQMLTHQNLAKWTQTWIELGGSREAMIALASYLWTKKDHQILTLTDQIALHTYKDWLPSQTRLYLDRNLSGLLGSDDNYGPLDISGALTDTDRALWSLALTPLPELP